LSVPVQRAEATPANIEADLCALAQVLGKLVESVSSLVEARREAPPDLCSRVEARWILAIGPGEEGSGDGGVRRVPVRRGRVTARACP
jgi:hypothetical protein